MPDPAAMHGALRHLRRTERRRLYHLLGDRELLARFLADRDETAFEELITRHGPMVRAICRRVLGPTADADDAFQAAFLVLIRRARSIRKADLLAGWLCAVAYRTARQALRRRSRRGARERGMDGLPEPARPDTPPNDWLPLFDAALQRLPAKYRDPVVLCEIQGLSRRDASARLGLAEGTLSSRLGRARDLLRRKLDRYGFPLALGSSLAPVVVPEALTASTAAAAIHVSSASVTAVVLCEGVLTAMLATKLKAGALVGTAVLVLGTVAGLQFTGPASGAGGPPGKDGPPAREAAKEPARPAATRSEPKPPTAAPADYEPFQGKWEVTAAERNGTAANPHGLGVDENWTFTGNTLTTGGDAKADVTEEFTIDPKAKPGAIDFTLTQFTNDGTGTLVRTPYQGVYRFDSDGALRICYRNKADNILRPTRFATAYNSGATVVVLRRPKVKADAPVVADSAVPGSWPATSTYEMLVPAPTKDADLGKVVGAWELVDVDGAPPDGAVNKLEAKGHPTGGERSKQRWEGLRRLQLLPAAGPMDLGNQPGASSYVAYVDLDATRSPKWFTLHATQSNRNDGPAPDIRVTVAVRLCGIYKLDGDKLVVCLPEAEGSPLLRPTDFKGDGEGGLYLLTYQRAAKTWKGEKVAPQPPVAADPLVGMATPVIPDATGAPFAAPVGVGPPAAPGLPTPGLAVPSAVPGGVLPTGPVPAGVTLPAPDPAPPATLGPTNPQPALSSSTPDLAPQKTEAPSSPTSDLDRLQGIWAIIQVDGKTLGPDEQRKETLEFLKDRVLSADGTHGRVRLDEAKAPRQITLTMGKPGEPPVTGIYRLDGEHLVIASSTKSPKLVPTTFESDPDAGISVMILERQKSPPPAPSAPTDAPRTGPSRKPPARDLQKEIDQLREQLKRLEKELKDRTD